MKCEIVTGNMPQLWEDLLSQLHEKEYPSESIRHYREAMGRVDRYMRENQILEYTEAVGETYLATHGGRISSGRQFYMSFYVRRLNDILNKRPYRTNTEVITAVEVSGGQSDPDDPVTVQFHIDGTTYTVSNVYYPDGDSQLAWVRWTTPDEPQDMTIDVDVSGPGSAQATIHCKIVDLDENPPPNPVADDRNDSFTPSPVPDRPEKTSAQWTIWDPWWQEYWVWHGDDEDGYWCDHGWWEFDLDRYSASLSADMEITPDEKNPTASGNSMKSGYGINQVVTARVSSSQRSATTALQNAVSYFPEFNYESFWRLLDRISISSSSSRLEFQKNEYSTYNRRTHFSPVWYPDGDYTVNTWAIDCWTPAGMLSVNLTDSLNIQGNLWDDWHIAPLDP